MIFVPQRPAIYFGIPCPCCEKDAIPYDDGTCPWCGTRLRKRKRTVRR